MRNLFLLSAMLIVFFSTGCRKSNPVYVPEKSVYTIAVLADNHYMDPSLLIKDGPAFQDYLLMNGKLLDESDAILREAIELIITQMYQTN